MTPLDPDPIREFQSWFEMASHAGARDATSMTLATATRDGAPSARVVLLKAVDERGFVFYTNYDSRKGREIEENPRAALVFYWPEIDRQVRVSGRVAKIPAAESDAYFASRSLGSRLSAAASPQSAAIASRAEIEEQRTRLQAEYRAAGPPRPNNWGGYCVNPEEIEFWNQGEFRLHDRVRYRRRPDGSWQVDRLAP
ncbi:MAG: pyridoxamine 5'-phosphate oxidase [Bryobacteraceae bacterium]